MQWESILFYSLALRELTELEPVHLLSGALESMFGQKKNILSMSDKSNDLMAIQWLDLRLGVKWMGSKKEPVDFK